MRQLSLVFGFWFFGSVGKEICRSARCIVRGCFPDDRCFLAGNWQMRFILADDWQMRFFGGGFWRGVSIYVYIYIYCI